MRFFFLSALAMQVRACNTSLLCPAWALLFICIIAITDQYFIRPIYYRLHPIYSMVHKIFRCCVAAQNTVNFFKRNPISCSVISLLSLSNIPVSAHLPLYTMYSWRIIPCGTKLSFLFLLFFVVLFSLQLGKIKMNIKNCTLEIGCRTVVRTLCAIVCITVNTKSCY